MAYEVLKECKEFTNYDFGFTSRFNSKSLSCYQQIVFRKFKIVNQYGLLKTFIRGRGWTQRCTRGSL